jgi:phosphoadenosine phosphosulfate reductase
MQNSTIPTPTTDPADVTFGYAGSGEAEDILRWAVDRFHPRLALSTSFKDAAIIDMLSRIRTDFRVVAIDTGRLPEETYECADAIRQRYGVHIEWVFPRHESVERLVRDKGMYSFRESLENRQECCYLRKVEPLSRALSGLDAWITGLRRDQGAARGAVRKLERDQVHGGILKINPIADWDMGRLWQYIRDNKVPYNRLYDKGYTSIGCEPCTRAVQPGDDPRAGRWWWEHPEHKECGIHVRDWTI